MCRRPEAVVVLSRATRIWLIAGAVVLVAVPTDIEAVRRDDPELARRWRRAVGEVLPAALDAGYRIEGMSKDGFYTLRYVL